MQLVPTRPEARPLGANEKAFWKLSEASPLNFTMLAQLRPRLDTERVREALLTLQARHPLLRAHIELRGGRPWFAWPAQVAPIPLEERATDRTESHGILEDELRRVIPWQQAPLARALLLTHGDQGCTLALIFHHAIADGMAAAAALRDVVWEATAGGPRSPLVHERSLAAESALPRTSRGLRGAWRRLRLLMRLVGEARRLRNPLPCPVRRPAAPHERTFHFEHRSLDEATATALSARARSLGATVHGAIGAALLFSIARAAGLGDERVVSLGSPINVRDRLSPAVGDQVGMYLAVSTYRGTISPATRFWELARGIRERIHDDLATGRAIDALPLMELFYQSLGGDKASAEDFGRKWAASNGTTGVTNVGRLDLPPPPGVDIERVQLIGFPSGLDVVNAMCSSYAGVMHINVNWPEPCLDRAGARALADDLEATLRAAVAADPTPARS